MSLQKDHPKNQHYVPQCLLRSFADKMGRIHVFDKAEERSFPSSTRNVAAENYFYDFQDDKGKAHSLEYFMQSLESKAAAILRGVVDRGDIAHLTDEERVTFSIFVAVQQQRVKGVRHRIRSTVDVVRAELVRRGIDPGNAFPELTDEEVKLSALNEIQIAKETAIHIHAKAWILYQAPVGEVPQVSWRRS